MLYGLVQFLFVRGQLCDIGPGQLAQLAGVTSAMHTAGPDPIEVLRSKCARRYQKKIRPSDSGDARRPPGMAGPKKAPRFNANRSARNDLE